MTEKPAPSSFPVDQLVPHRPPMLLISELSQCAEDDGYGYADVSAGQLFVDAAGALEPVVLIEMLAQEVAAYKGYEARLAGRGVRPGFLVGVKGFKVTRPALDGERLRLMLRRETSVGNATYMMGWAAAGDHEIASCTLNLWELDESMPFPPPPEVAPVDRPACPVPAALKPDQRSPAMRAILQSLDAVERGPAEGELRGVFQFGPSFPCFKGHFPEFGLLPGVMMVQSMLALAEHGAGRPLRLASIDKAKFAGMILPGNRVEAKATCRRGAEGVLVRASLAVDGKAISSASLLAVEA